MKHIIVFEKTDRIEALRGFSADIIICDVKLTKKLKQVMLPMVASSDGYIVCKDGKIMRWNDGD
mgnify:CR=1 FL=1